MAQPKRNIYVQMPAQPTYTPDDVYRIVWEARHIYNEHANTPYNRLRGIIKWWVSKFNI